MLVVTTDNIPGYEVGLLGAVKGTVVEQISIEYASDYEKGVAAQNYNVAIDKAVQIATEEAEKLGADAIVSLKFSYNNMDSRNYGKGIVIITAYGTAAAIKYL